MPEDVLALIRIKEIFLSLQGESSRVGWPTVFIRLTGCPLRCRWCDTEYAFSGGELLSIRDILAQVEKFSTRFVCVTGGEPLAQKNCLALLSTLCDAGLSVSLETSGALDIAAVDKRVARIVDLKAPGSGEETKNNLANLSLLTPNDELKIVLADRRDYEWACKHIRAYQLPARCTVLLSPVAGELSPSLLAEWILADRLPVRLQLQLHKILWGQVPGR